MAMYAASVPQLNHTHARRARIYKKGTFLPATRLSIQPEKAAGMGHSRMARPPRSLPSFPSHPPVLRIDCAHIACYHYSARILSFSLRPGCNNRPRSASPPRTTISPGSGSSLYYTPRPQS